MTKDEALKLALEALEFMLEFSRIGGSYQEYGRHKHLRWVKTENAITAIKEALAEPKELNFCPRCGKRAADLTTIHTCTPPRENA
jgi:hypothetical protein